MRSYSVPTSQFSGNFFYGVGGFSHTVFYKDAVFYKLLTVLNPHLRVLKFYLIMIVITSKCNGSKYIYCHVIEYRYQCSGSESIEYTIFLGLPDSDLLVRGMNLDPDPDSSIIKQK